MPPPILPAPPAVEWPTIDPNLPEASARSQYVAKLAVSIADMAIDLDRLENGGTVKSLFDDYGAPPITLDDTKAEIRRRMRMIDAALDSMPAN
jgi:hypothetical protein